MGELEIWLHERKCSWSRHVALLSCYIYHIYFLSYLIFKIRQELPRNS